MILAVAGTGTGVGKTTVGVALVRLLAKRFTVRAFKPLETGGDDDGRALTEASGFDAGPLIQLALPAAANVAARAEGRELDLGSLARSVWERATEANVLVLETPGGLFSPLHDDGTTNADWLERVEPDCLVLVAPNRLGVLHDVEAVRRASKRRIDAVVLTGWASDASAVSNAEEIGRRLSVVSMRGVGDLGELEGWVDRLVVGR